MVLFFFFADFIFNCSPVKLDTKVNINQIPVIFQKELVLVAQQEPINLIHGWATWCNSCEETFSSLGKLNEAYQSIPITSIIFDDRNMNKDLNVPAWLKEKMFISGEDPELLMNVFPDKWSGTIPFIIISVKDKSQFSNKSIPGGIRYFYGLNEINEISKFIDFLYYDMKK